MSLLIDLKREIESKKTLRDALVSKLEENKRKLKKVLEEERHAQRAQLILQQVAKETQEQLEYHISELVSLSLSAVFEDPYTLRLVYELKRSKMEAQFIFQRGENIVHPMEGGGYGAIDIAHFALRCSLWSLRSKELDNVIISDEPFKNINDPTRRLHQNAVEMVKEVSDRLGLQFIITSQIPEFRDVADCVYEVTMRNGISKVKKV